MINKDVNNNYCELSGIVFGEIRLSHEVYGEKFNTFILEVERLSGIKDYINIIFSENCPGGSVNPGDMIFVKGQFRSYNNYSGTGSRLLLNVFAKELMLCENDERENINYIMLNGYLCKPPVYRITPFGREITDILLAVNRIHNKSDYIPCIIWGKNASSASELKVGDNITLHGRIQSREYKKRLENDEVISKIAYEVSVNKFEHNIQ